MTISIDIRSFLGFSRVGDVKQIKQNYIKIHWWDFYFKSLLFLTLFVSLTKVTIFYLKKLVSCQLNRNLIATIVPILSPQDNIARISVFAWNQNHFQFPNAYKEIQNKKNTEYLIQMLAYRDFAQISS